MIIRYPKVVAKNKEENYRSTVDVIFSVPVLRKYTETLGQNPKERNSRTQVKREILNMGFCGTISRALFGSTGSNKKRHGPGKLSIWLYEVADTDPVEDNVYTGLRQPQSLYFSLYFSVRTGEVGSRDIFKLEHTYFCKAFISFKNQGKSAK